MNVAESLGDERWAVEGGNRLPLPNYKWGYRGTLFCGHCPPGSPRRSLAWTVSPKAEHSQLPLLAL